MAPTPQSRSSQELINVKLLLIGNSSVGKSSLLLRFSDKQWLPEDEASATIGVDFRVSALSLCSLATISPSLSLFLLTWGYTTVCQIHKLEVRGRKVKMSIWVRRLPCHLKGLALRCFVYILFILGHCRPRTFSDHHRIVLPRSAGRHTRYEQFTRATFSLSLSLSLSPSWLTQGLISVLACCARASRTCVVMCAFLVYDVSNRESFEALPRWLEELENYVPPEVVKIVVGNKLDKVKCFPILLTADA